MIQLCWGGSYGWSVESSSSQWLRGLSRVCCRPASRIFVATISSGHSRVILMWGVADYRWMYREARTDSSVRVSIEKDGARIAHGDRCSVWSGLRDVYGSW